MDALVAEALSCRAALQLLQVNKASKVIVETDSLLLASVINNLDSYFSSLGLIIQDCIDLLRTIPDCSVIFARRSMNFIAHFLARRACLESGLSVWVENPPVSIIDAISFEMIQ